MSLHITRMQLRIPSDFGSRAEGIARAVAAATVSLPLPGTRRIDTLRVGPVHLTEGATERDVVTAITNSIADQLRGTP